MVDNFFWLLNFQLEVITSVENKIASTFNSAYSLYLKARTTGLIEHSDSTIPAASAISFYLYL